jgi:phosphoadenosine phosphosulfate reductase
MTGRKPFKEAQDHIFWCDSCNVPLITEKCDTCGSQGRQVRLSPPADVRPCFPYERSIIRGLLESEYGYDLIGERLVLLNKVPGDDKADEVIVDGHTMGVVYYDLADAGYRLDLRLYGAKLLIPFATRKIAKVDVPRDMHLNGKPIRGSMVVEASPDIRKGDIILIKVSDSFGGFGVAKKDACEIKNPAENTIRIRKVSGGMARLSDKASTIEDAVAANRRALMDMEKGAINTIKAIMSQHRYKELPVTVSFSGGKDSLAVLNIARKAVKRLEAFYIDTGLEFPETARFAEKAASSMGVPLIVERAGTAFDENFPAFGPPAKDFRWCCKVCKLGPITRLLSRYKKGVVTIDGKRRYESFQRGGIGSTEKNPFVPGQTSIYPIKDWRALEVWLYIRMENLQYNELYDKGFERIGCWLCPAALQAEYHRMKELHPDLYDGWERRLYAWAEEKGLSPDYVRYGFWRWKSHPKKMLIIASEKRIQLQPQNEEGMALNVLRGVSPCSSGGYSIEGALSLPSWAAMEDMAEILRTLGTPIYSEDLGLILVKGPRGTVKIFAGGQIYASSRNKEEAARLFEDAVKQALRASLCTRCGICVKSCPSRAIRLDGRIKIDGQKCSHCGRCTEGCVVARYYSRLIEKPKNISPT